jgi:hypothetical protein
VFLGLSAGTAYVVTVRNARQCSVSSAPITISEPAVLTATDALQPIQRSPTTIITVTAAGGMVAICIILMEATLHPIRTPLIIQLPNHSKLYSKRCQRL